MCVGGRGGGGEEWRGWRFSNNNFIPKAIQLIGEYIHFLQYITMIYILHDIISGRTRLYIQQTYLILDIQSKSVQYLGIFYKSVQLYMCL